MDYSRWDPHWWNVATHRWNVATHRWNVAAHQWNVATHRWNVAAHRWNVAAHRWNVAAHRWNVAAHRWNTAKLWNITHGSSPHYWHTAYLFADHWHLSYHWWLTHQWCLTNHWWFAADHRGLAHTHWWNYTHWRNLLSVSWFHTRGHSWSDLRHNAWFGKHRVIHFWSSGLIGLIDIFLSGSVLLLILVISLYSWLLDNDSFLSFPVELSMSYVQVVFYVSSLVVRSKRRALVVHHENFGVFRVGSDVIQQSFKVTFVDIIVEMDDKSSGDSVVGPPRFRDGFVLEFSNLDSFIVEIEGLLFDDVEREKLVLAGGGLFVFGRDNGGTFG